MKVDFKKIFIKYFLPPFIFIGILTLKTYLEIDYIAPFDSDHVIIYLAFLMGTWMFWALLDYFQHVTGILMAETWVSRIIFIIVALALFYIYRINGRI
ncbi:hypothetical protein H3N56_03150 [Cetobacterium sp. 2A]|uniref:hypothetical protein n=1 Tax=Cetobacterium sp. 2A TaxID=2754723 RepID=UPI00163CC123|nr:hypothetical protein [Cetobacterium sp. 2A]MBC2855492.1 hypothetical protein [Cetobacterium sp. 2A]